MMINWTCNIGAVKVFAIEDENMLYMQLLKYVFHNYNQFILLTV